MRSILRFACFVFCIAPASLWAASSPWAHHDVVDVRLVAPYDVAPPAGPISLGIELRLAADWHAYWRDSGDAGFPPSLDLTATPVSVRDAELHFPAPERFAVAGGLTAIGYADHVVYPVTAELAGDTPKHGSLHLQAVVDYVVCSDECLPFHDLLNLDLPQGTAPPDHDAAQLLATWQARLPQPWRSVAGATQQIQWRAEGELFFDLQVPNNAVDDGSDLFLNPVAAVRFGTPERARSDHGVRFRIPVSASDISRGLPEQLPVSWVVTGLRTADGEPLSLKGEAQVATTANTPTSPEKPSVGSTNSRFAPARAFLDGLLLALSPSLLVLLVLYPLLPHRQLRRDLGLHALVWPVFSGSFAGFLLWATVARGCTPASATPFELPLLWAVLALPQLLLVLVLWLRGSERIRLGTSAGRDVFIAVLAPLLAVPWAPLTRSGGAVFSGRSPSLEVAFMALGFSALFLLAGLAGGVVAELRDHMPGRRTSVVLGFLPTITLVWISYQLAARLPSPHLAALQLTWLAAALTLQLYAASSRSRLRALWALATLLCALASLYLAA